MDRLGGLSEPSHGGHARRSGGGGRALEKHSSGMSLESTASSGGTTRSSGGDAARATRGSGLSRGAVLKKLGQQTELSRKTSFSSGSSSCLIGSGSSLAELNRSAAAAHPVANKESRHCRL